MNEAARESSLSHVRLHRVLSADENLSSATILNILEAIALSIIEKVAGIVV